jgi:hypothetical protein
VTKTPRLKLKDHDGNVVFEKHGFVHLKLKASGQVRRIGWIHQGVFHCKRTEAHVHNAAQGFGFNYDLIRNGPALSVLVYGPEQIRYHQTTDFIIKNGQVMNFKRAGFELQIFLPLSEFVAVRPIPQEPS